MKVLLLTENWAQVGGIQNYLQGIVKYLSANTADKPARVVEVVEPSQRRFFWPLIKPRWLPLFVSLYMKVKRAKAGTEPYQLMFCGKALFEGLVGYYLKKYLGLPYVVFTYAMEIDTWLAATGTRRKLARVIRNADRLVYINDRTKHQLLALGATEQQLVKIWPGIGEEWFAKGVRYSKEKVPDTLNITLKIEQPYILAVGRLVPRKGFDLLIEAFSQLDQVKYGELQLVTVGDGPERENLEKCAEQHWVNPRVHFLGTVAEDELRSLYAGALFFALTPRADASLVEGFGIVYLEAAAAGLSVLGTASGGVAEAVVHKQTGLVVAPTAKAVTEGLTYLLDNEIERKRMSEIGKKRAWEEFRWPKRILLVKGVIDAVVSEGVLRNRNPHPNPLPMQGEGK